MEKRRKRTGFRFFHFINRNRALTSPEHVYHPMTAKRAESSETQSPSSFTCRPINTEAGEHDLNSLCLAVNGNASRASCLTRADFLPLGAL
ncbi:hypothetical protein CEXT_619481 [Caerostris extrusa]|uniref:Uncharacterized protein n=1 Tax=Caerostris extrusa TaxID=172846 RepID=A0AAV4N5C1_CAEEX|nr:hypothetical protein CEXT_619481 [Caerostris extrusa]